MAIKIEGFPEFLAPVYNRCIYYVSSTNVAKEAFKYVGVLKDGATEIATVKVSPRPSDNFGEFEVQRLISPLITRHIELDMYSSVDPVENYKNIEIEFGEEYKAEWNYTSVTSRASGAFTGNTQLGAAAVVGNEHGYIVGDQIEITIIHPFLTGIHTVVEVVDAYNIVLNLAYQVAPGTSGTTYYADGRTEQDLNLATDTRRYYNAAFSFIDFRTYNSGDYIVNVFTRKFVSSLVDNFRVSPEFDMWLNIANDISVAVGKIIVDNGTDTYELTLDLSGDMTQFYIGINDSNYMPITGALPIIKDDTTQLDFYFEKGGVQASRIQTLLIDRRCGPEDYSILFEDRLGSLIPWTFNLHSEETQNIERLEYRQELGDLKPANTWGYLTSDRGTTTVDIKETRTLILRSQYMTYEEEQYFKELMTSPTVFVKIDDNYVSCVIRNSSTTYNGQGRKALRRHDITIEFANQDNINI